MKRRNIFRIILICYILTGGYTRMMATNSESNPVALPTPYCKQVLLCSPSDSVRITLLGLTLHADSGSVIDAFTLSAERLPSTEAVAPMPSGMMNVTTGRAVYRLLPQG